MDSTEWVVYTVYCPFGCSTLGFWLATAAAFWLGHLLSRMTMLAPERLLRFNNLGGAPATHKRSGF